MSDCGNGCYEVGGEWIAENPDCPVHGNPPPTEVEVLALEAQALLAKRLLHPIEVEAFLRKVAALKSP